MAFWSGETLCTIGDGLVEPFDVKQIDCNAYSLRMGGQYYRTADDEKASGEQKKTRLSPKETFLIPAGQFAFLLSKETVKIPKNAMAFISMRTGIKFQGLINVSGFHVDPGYEGKLIYAVYNASPSSIELAEDELVFKIWFCSLDQMSGPDYSKGIGDGLHEITSEMIRGMRREILSLQNLANKLRDQENDIKIRFSEQKPVIESLTFVWRAITISVIVAIIVALLSIAVPVLYSTGKLLAGKWGIDISSNQSPEDVPLLAKQTVTAQSRTSDAGLYVAITNTWKCLTDWTTALTTGQSELNSPVPSRQPSP